ncbi:hypothetical protein ACVBEF_09770 [Glaciimonas sp. GG7]
MPEVSEVGLARPSTIPQQPCNSPESSPVLERLTAGRRSSETLPIEPEAAHDTEQEALLRAITYINAFKCAVKSANHFSDYYDLGYRQAEAALLRVAPLTGKSAPDHVEGVNETKIKKFLYQGDMFMAAMGNTSKTARNVNFIRETISLGICGSLLAIMYAGMQSHPDRKLSAADHPTGSSFGNWGLTVLEAVKALVTMSLRSPTADRVDLVCKIEARMTVALALLDACLEDPETAAPAEDATLRDCASYTVLQLLEKGQAAAALPAMLNNLVAPLRVMLLSARATGGDTAAASVSGAAALTQSALDSLRALLNATGAWAGDAIFGGHIDRNRAQLPANVEKFRNADQDHEGILQRLGKMNLLFTHLDTELLLAFNANPELVAKYQAKDNDVQTLETLRTFLDNNRFIYLVNDDSRLIHREQTSPWGEKVVNGTVEPSCRALLLRVPQRLMRTTEHLLAKPVEAILARTGSTNNSVLKKVTVEEATPV